MDLKRCPICEKEKPTSDYYNYFSKKRNCIRIGNYCKECKSKDATIRAAAYYAQHKDEKKEYSKEYRKRNHEKIRKVSQRFKKKYRKELQDCYVVDQMRQKFGISTQDIRNSPELISIYRNQLFIKRKIKNHGKK